MVFSNLSLKSADETYPEAIRRALSYLRETDFEELPDGEYSLTGRQMYAKVFHLQTKPVQETHPELHREYIDVQYWINGREKFGIAPCTGEARMVDRDVAEDVYFYGEAPGESFVLAMAGDYAVFYPWDYHRPGTWAGENPEECRKVVVKVGMALLKGMPDGEEGGQIPVKRAVYGNQPSEKQDGRLTGKEDGPAWEKGGDTV